MGIPKDFIWGRDLTQIILDMSLLIRAFHAVVEG